MSKSYKKHSYTGHCSGSDKVAKVAANRKLRHINKVYMAKGYELKNLREVSNVYDFPKDGKVYINAIIKK